MSNDQAEKTTPQSRIGAVIAWVMQLKPVRVFGHYSRRRGAILAGGLSYQAIFAVFAAIWVAFSIIGLFLQSNDALRQSLFDVLSSSVPGLIDTAESDGAIDPEMLLDTGALSWTGALALFGLLFTALGWLASGRESIRDLFDLGPLPGNLILQKLKDLGLAIGFGVVVLISAALSVFSTAALDTVFGWVGIGNDSFFANALARVVGLAIVLALDTLVLAAFFRVVAAIVIPFRRLLAGAFLGGIGLGVLKVLGSTLLGGASNNPLLASFAVIIGLLIWFNLICQVILLSSTWVAVGMIDAGIPLDPVAEAARLEREAAERAAARAAEELARPKGFARFIPRRWRKTNTDPASRATATGAAGDVRGSN
ncbi:membrane protein [Glaciihabitans tibetensis]|uniref:Membrane protein n=1 Tax=Glaciihabitans tibetensis TaxID=1266600 RepID=A0A2T0VF95_9MICO|nr:YihY/virulence factor BrkB family protein [Glaciihabitans tibetensis]PRY68832.1 membrane protein [Glaciihabitans tibetensis]